MNQITEIKRCTVGHNGQPPKRSFSSEQEGLDFESRNRAEYLRPQQWVYKCEDCPDYHLTSKSPGTGTIAQVNYATAGAPETTKGRKYVDTDEVLRLKEQGLTNTEIAERLDVTPATVAYHLKKDEKPESQLITFEQWQAERIKLEGDLARTIQSFQEKITHAKAMEARLAFNFTYVPGGVIFTRDGREFKLLKQDLKVFLSGKDLEMVLAEIEKAEAMAAAA